MAPNPTATREWERRLSVPAEIDSLDWAVDMLVNSIAELRVEMIELSAEVEQLRREPVS
jgi:hypothetical protein